MGKKLDVVRVDMLHKIALQSFYTDSALVVRCLKEALRIAQANRYDYGEAYSFYLLGKIYGNILLDLPRSIAFHKQSFVLADKIDSLPLAVDNQLQLGELHHSLDLYASAIHHFFIVLRYNRLLKDTAMQVKALTNIARIYALYGESSYGEAMRKFESALQQAGSLNDEALRTYTTVFLSSTLIRKGEYNRAEQYLSVIPALEIDGRYPQLLATAYTNSGNVLLARQDTVGARQFFYKALKLCQDTNQAMSLVYECAESMVGLGKTAQAKGDYKIAEQHYQQALLRYKKIGTRTKIASVCGALKTLALLQHKDNQALHFQILQMNYLDSLHQAQQQDLLAVTFSANATQEADTGDVHGNTYFIYLLEALVSIIILLTTMLLYSNRLSSGAVKEKSALVLEKTIIQKELDEKKLQADRLRLQIEANAKSLTANTLNLIQKNEILDKIKTLSQEIRNAPSAELPSRINALLQMANFALNIDKDWENFKIYFEQIHSDFFDNLKARFPDLNSNDLKICALIKLNLDTKEIATVMDISPESVKVARSRLRKKLQLEPSDNLSSFITMV